MAGLSPNYREYALFCKAALFGKQGMREKERSAYFEIRIFKGHLTKMGGDIQLW